MTTSEEQRLLKLRERIKKISYAPNCFIVLSFPKRDTDPYFDEFRVTTLITFLYQGETHAVEWEPVYGPIQIFTKAPEDYEGETIPHWTFDRVIPKPFDWSQSAVDREELPQAANRGDFDYIFSVLKQWSQR